jgi:acyl-coenzyme A synthetase/AMP-(fatty) acid ligase
MSGQRLSIEDRSPWPPCPSPFNLSAHVLQRADAHPDKIALIVAGPDDATRWTYGQILRAVRGVGSGLLGLGLVPGDRILLRLGNSVTFPIAYLGAIAAGLVPIPTSAALTQPEISRICALVRPALIVADPAIALPEPMTCPCLTGADLLEMAGQAPCVWNMGDPNRLAYIVMTSGTSGTPRAVAHAHRAIWARGMMQSGWTGLIEDDRLLHSGALNWTYTLGTGLLDPWTVGATSIVTGDGVEARVLPGLMQDHDVTILAAVPGVYRRMLREILPILPALRHGLSAGEALPAPLRSDWQSRTGTDLHQALGLTEVSTFLSGSPMMPNLPNATGWVQPGRRVAILKRSNPVARGIAGNLAIDRNDPGLMLGYLGHDGTVTNARVGEWFETGDRAVMDDNGSITHLGRTDDMITAGGYRVAPVEVETVILTFPGISECVVFDHEPVAGTHIIACVFASTGQIDPAALSEYVRTRLAAWKCPREWRAVAQLPTGLNGKLNRSALRSLLLKDIP